MIGLIQFSITVHYSLFPDSYRGCDEC